MILSDGVRDVKVSPTDVMAPAEVLVEKKNVGGPGDAKKTSPILAFFAHYMIGDGEQMGALLALILLMTSYIFYKRITNKTINK